MSRHHDELGEPQASLALDSRLRPLGGAPPYSDADDLCDDLGVGQAHMIGLSRAYRHPLREGTG